ncbi:hypothetical protein [Pannonibacter phragmitetus]|uniref:hypothetical protein n=1 Tax=Pannonibacter phragmitetus TaxID=121719 RepID=UPI003D2EF3D3
MMPVTLPKATGYRPFHSALFLTLLVLLTLAYFAKMFGGWIEHASRQAELRTAEARLVTLWLGDRRVTVPMNMLPKPEQRKEGSFHERLTLEVNWPSMTGYAGSGGNKSNRPATEMPISVELMASRKVETVMERMDTTLRRLAAGKPQTGQAGLYMLDMSGKAGASEDVLFYEDDGTGLETGFAARCRMPKDAPATCLRDMRLAPDLVASYRFDMKLLSSWGRLDRQMGALFETFLPH